jgi:outer membrane receptor protein involved in Fe transport
MTVRSLFPIFFVAAALCLAQSERGSITGSVTDTSHAAVVNAPVRVVNTATNAVSNVTTSSSGEYSAANLGPGSYRVEVTMPGFKKAIVSSVAVTAGATVRADVELQLGVASQTVEVQAHSVEVQTEDAKISTSVSTVMVDELPLVVSGGMRSVFGLEAIAPDAKGGASLVLGGGQGGASGATFDGVPVNTNRQASGTETAFLTPSVESITEFSVDTNGFKAEYGQAGGGVVSFASKSGTNIVHGSAYDFIRNDDVDARGFFAASPGIYKQNDYGVSLGGPVWIPKVYHGRNRTFFFVSYEGFTDRIGTNGSFSSVPTPQMYQGNFTQWVNSKNQELIIYDPATTALQSNGTYTRTPFPGNIIPQTDFSTVTKQFLALAENVLLPNRPGIVPGTFGYINNNYVSAGGESAEQTNKLGARFDHAISNNHRLSYVFNRTTDLVQPGTGGPSGIPLPFNGFSDSTYTAYLHRITYDWIVTPRMANHLSFGINRFDKDAFSANVSTGNWKDKVCILNAINCNVNMGNVTFSDLSGWGTAADNGTKQPSWTLKDDLNYVRGAHTFKFGATYDHQEANGFGQQTIAGTAGFSFLETAVPGSTTNTSGAAFASFLLGNADTGGTETVRFVNDIYRYYGFYAQDDWRVSKKLVINYGLRYEFTLPPISGNNQLSNFSPTTPNPAANGYLGALVFAGTGPGETGTRNLTPGYYSAFSPRLGLAYSPNSKTVIRAGAARSFGRVSALASSSHYAGYDGVYTFTSPNQGISPAFNWDTGLPPYLLPPQVNPSFANNQNVDDWNGNASRPNTYDNWTLSIQRQLTQHLTLETDYNAVVGEHLNADLMDLNQVPMSVMNGLIAKYGAAQAISLMNSNIASATAVAAGFTPPYASFTTQSDDTVSQALRAYPQYLTVDAASGGGDRSGHSSYQAAELKLDYKASGSLLFQGSYVFSKILTNSDNFAASGGSEDQANPGLEKSVGSFDQTHTVHLNTVYNLPVGKGHHWLSGPGVANRLIGGWRVSSVQTYNSGTPIGVTRNANLPIFNTANRPMCTTYDWRTPITGAFDPNKDTFLNAAAFPAQPVGALGDCPRLNSQVRNFATLNENVSLAKTFSVSERFRLDFRAEAFNILNRVQFGGPSSNLNSASFGIVSSQANSPRQLQAALKLYW